MIYYTYDLWFTIVFECPDTQYIVYLFLTLLVSFFQGMPRLVSMSLLALSMPYLLTWLYVTISSRFHVDVPRTDIYWPSDYLYYRFLQGFYSWVDLVNLSTLSEWLSREDSPSFKGVFRSHNICEHGWCSFSHIHKNICSTRVIVDRWTFQPELAQPLVCDFSNL